MVRTLLQTQVLDYLQSRGDAGMRAHDIAKAIDAKPDSVLKTLHRLLIHDLVRRKGRLWLHREDPDPTSP